MDEPEIQLAGAEASGSHVDSLQRVSGEVHLSKSAGDKESVRETAEGDQGESASHPVRERLLARAAEARRARGTTPEQEGSDSGRGMEEELERIAIRRPPAAPRAGRRAALSPNVVALFGTLFGLAVVAALFAVLIRLDPRSPSGGPSLAAPTKPALEPTKAPPAPAPKRARKRIPGPWRIADSKDARLRKIEGRIGREPFLKAVTQVGVDQGQVYRVLTALKELKNLNKCDREDRFIALVDRASSRLKAFEYLVSKEEVYQAKEGEDGLLKGVRLDLKVERQRVQGAVRFDRDTFAASAEAAGFEPGLSKALDDALQGHSGVAQFKHGDRLRIVAQEVTVLGEFTRYAGLEALEYLPADEGAEPVRIYYFNGTRSRGYYDALGRSPFEGGWRKPIKGAPITSHFNPKRLHPVLKKIMPHTGTDFGAAMGAPVGASAPGIIKSIGYAGPSGNLVLLEHPGGYETGYAHLSRFEEGLKVGDRVGRLQIVGYVGSTGRSTGPHLHFSVKKNGKFIDAETLNLDSLHVLPKDEREQFAATRAQYDKLIDAISLPEPLAQPVRAPSSNASEGMADDASDELHDGVDDPEPKDVPQAPKAPPPAPPPPGKTANGPPRSGSSIYLSDRELIESQTSIDDGEVEE